MWRSGSSLCVGRGIGRHSLVSVASYRKSAPRRHSVLERSRAFYSILEHSGAFWSVLEHSRAFLEHASVFPQRSAGGESQCRAPQLVSSRSAAQTTEQRRAVGECPQRRADAQSSAVGEFPQRSAGGESQRRAPQL
eukprot:gene3161-biopygen3655